MGGKLPARDPGPCHRTERTASPPADPRLRELPSRPPHSRLPGEGHAKPAASRAEASCGLNRDFHPAIGRSPPSLLLAPGGIDLLGSPSPLRESHSRSQRQHLPGRSARRGRRPRGDLKDTVAETSPSRLRWRQRDSYRAVCPHRPCGTALAASSPFRNVAPRCGSNSDYTQPSQNFSQLPPKSRFS